MPDLLVIAILLLSSIASLIIGNVIWDLWGNSIKMKIKEKLPEGTNTDSGAVTK